MKTERYIVDKQANGESYRKRENEEQCEISSKAVQN